MFDLKGNDIVYTSDPNLDKCVIFAGKQGKIALRHGVIGKQKHVEEEKILKKVAEVYAA